MDMSNVKKRPNETDARANVAGQETNKFRKVTQAVTVETKIVGKTSEKKMTNDDELGGIDYKPSLEVLLNGISNFELCDNVIASMTKQSKQNNRENPSTSHGGSPVTLATGDEGCDITSDSESEFCPDWSSAGSFASSTNLDDVESSEDDVTSLRDKSTYVTLELDDERASAGKYKIPYYVTYDVTKQVASLPVPAAGNDDVDDISMTSQSVKSDDGKSKDGNKFKPQAIRRVKSMIYETGLDNEIAADQRMRVLMRKQVTDVVHRSTSPVALSPLLSVEDVGALKRSSSQINVKYSLKRSRSNLAVTAAYFKRPITVPNDVIHEEIDEEKQNKEFKDTTD